MSCNHPLKGFPIGFHPSGKTEYKICSYDVDHLEYLNGKWFEVGSYLPNYQFQKIVREFVQIPCGQCFACRLQYSRDWANRCMLELQYHDSAYFVTLTYNDENVPRHDYVSYSDGEKLQSLSLEKRDLQLFFKRLRKAYGNDHIRYFCAGEYGSETFRPHYHCIIYGLHLDDLQFYKKNLMGHKFFNSPRLEKIWQHGFVVVGEVTWETCAYTARYITKKLKGQEAVYYDLMNIEPEFTVMSRKPGIARQYYDDHKDEIYKTEYINIATEKGGLKFKPPRYYDHLYDFDCPEQMQEIKEIRKRMASAASDLKLSRTSLSYLEMLAVEEENLIARTNSLVRNEI